MLAAVIALGVLMWWWPSYRGWGAAAAGLGLTLLLWVLSRLAAGRRSIPGSPVHAALLVPACVLIAHLVRASVAGMHEGGYVFRGALVFSIIVQLAMLSLGVMLAQGLLPGAARHVWVLGTCGAAMMVGSAAAMLWGEARAVRTALALVGFAGVGVWLTMLWGLGGDGDEAEPSPQRRLLRGACLAVGVAAAGALAAVAPLQAVLVAAVAAAAVLLGAVVFPQRRALLLAVGGALAVASAALLAGVQWMRAAIRDLLLATRGAGWFGHGEEAFRRISASDSGLAVLAQAVGWVGLGCFLVGAAAALAVLLVGSRRGHRGDRARAILWTTAAGAVGCALLAPVGPFMPSVTLAVALVWGLLPAMLGRPERRRSGVILLAGIAAMAVLLGMLPDRGLVTWTATTFGLNDTMEHMAAGVVLAAVTVWLLGARRWWLGLAGIVLAALAGGPGEALQRAMASGTPELRDWAHHATGSAAFALPYLLCLGARAAEATPRPARATQPGG